MTLARYVTFDLVKHPDADRLSIARIHGTDWQCVTATDQWGEARAGIYIAVDALLDPARPEFAFLKATKTLADGRPAARLKTVRLRGVLSQGLLIPMPAGASGDLDVALGIERYEPPVDVAMNGDQVRRPQTFATYHRIENAKNFPFVFEDGEPVRILEKIHGTSGMVSVVDAGIVDSNGTTTLTYGVGTHATARDPAGMNLYSRMARQHFPESDMRRIASALGTKWQCIVYFEIFGSKVQDLQYGCAPGTQAVRVFDVLVDGVFQPFDVVVSIALGLRVDTAPVLYRGPFSKAKVMELRDGPSTIPGATHVREGVVVTADPEATDGAVGRKILKYVSDAYLERRGAKDGH